MFKSTRTDIRKHLPCSHPDIQKRKQSLSHQGDTGDQFSKGGELKAVLHLHYKIHDKKLEVVGKRRGETKCENNTGENSAERYGKIKKPTMRGKAQCLLRGQKKAARSQA